MTTRAVCTTFSPEGFEEYGKQFLESYVWHWTVPLYVGVEGKDAVDRTSWFLRGKPCAVTVFDIFYSGRLGVFLATQPNPSKDYRYRADPFCRKVYALTEKVPDVDWWIWLDADTVTDKPIDEGFLDRACQGEVSYLGRKDWHHSECGFVAYHVGGRGREVLERLVGVYDTGEIYEHMEWHDSYIFDRVREEFPSEWFHNLSEGVAGLHVWDGSLLGERMRHLKGPLRKKGKMPAETESAYWSEKERAVGT